MAVAVPATAAEHAAGNYCSCSAAHKAATLLHSATELLGLKTGTRTKLGIVTSSASQTGAVTAPVEKRLHRQQLNCGCSWAAPPRGRRGLLAVGASPAVPGRPHPPTEKPWWEKSLVHKPVCNSSVRSARCLCCTNASLHYKRGDAQWLCE